MPVARVSKFLIVVAAAASSLPVVAQTSYPNRPIKRPDVRTRLIEQGADPDPGTPDQLTAHIHAEVERFQRLVKAVGIPMQ